MPNSVIQRNSLVLKGASKIDFGAIIKKVAINRM